VIRYWCQATVILYSGEVPQARSCHCPFVKSEGNGYF
jgi:hypothetical protein